MTDVREIEHAWIATPDGVRLAVQLWLPDLAEPVPAVLEATPYRKRDATRAYGSYWGRKLAENGIAYARLDARGSGDSEGLLLDEYLPQEQADCAAAIAWLAAQPWSNGAVGMRGVSWGGFITLATAALAPPALKAVMPMCCSDRRYTDDAHFIGGGFALTGLKWATSFKAVMAGPPDPATFGPDWEAEWLKRLEATPPIAAQWLSHQREDGFWRQGSVGFDPGAIQCPAYLVGGWVDPYNEQISRLLRSLTGPVKALIGPWQHGYPQPAAPGPGLDWIVEETRWWRHWLCGEPSGVMEGPQVWAYMPEKSAAEAGGGPIPGRWIAEPAWPARTEARELPLGRWRLGGGERDVVEIASDAVVGLSMPEWVPFAPPQFPQEQSMEDDESLAFDSDTLEAPLEILGAPVVRLRIAASAALAKIAARLCEVTSDGRSWLVSYGVLNLTHRDSHAQPAPLEPGRFYVIELPLYLTARRLGAGSHLRLALSESLWPLMWPSPKPVTLSIDLAASSLALPVRDASLAEPEFPIPIVETRAGSGRGDPMIERRIEADCRVVFREVWPTSHGAIEDTGTTIERSGANVEVEWLPEEPDTCRWRAWQTVRYLRGDWDCGLESEVALTADVATFHVRERLTARRGDVVVFEREHRTDVPRDLM